MKTYKKIKLMLVTIMLGLATSNVSQAQVILSDFNNTGFTGGTYGTWNPASGAIFTNANFVEIGGNATVSGGGTVNLSSTLDLSSLTSQNLELLVRDGQAGSQNAPGSFLLQLDDSNNHKLGFVFDTSSLNPSTGAFTSLQHALLTPNYTTGGTFDFSQVTKFEILGNFSTNNPFNLQFAQIDITEPPAAAPEPSTGFLLVAGAGLLVVFLRRKTKLD